MSYKTSLAYTLLATTLLTTSVYAASETPAAPEPTLMQKAEKAVARVTGNPMAGVKPDMKHVLDATADLDGEPIEDLEPVEARKQPLPGDGLKHYLTEQKQSTEPEAGVEVRDMVIDGAVGKINARVYMPAETKPDAQLPVVVYFHGGGWVIADLDDYDASPRAVSKAAKAIVVSVDYRKAPEDKFPAAHDDAVAAYKWVLANIGNVGGDPARVAVMGESAGGNLAINVAIAARDQNLQMPLSQVLIYPVAGVDMETPSYQDSEDAQPLNKAMMEWFIKHALKDDKDKQDPRIDLIGKADVKSLPPTTLITAQIDPLRSDGELLAKKLKDAGVQVNHKNYEGVTHEFFGLAAGVADAKEAQKLVAEQLTKAFDKL